MSKSPAVEKTTKGYLTGYKSAEKWLLCTWRNEPRNKRDLRNQHSGKDNSGFRKEKTGMSESPAVEGKEK